MLPVVAARGRIRATAGRLRTVICGGEALTAGARARGSTRLSQRRLRNVYGPTETTFDTDVAGRAGATRRAQTVPIGRPIANTRVYVLDAHGEPVPVGVAGELLHRRRRRRARLPEPPGADRRAFRRRSVRAGAGRADVPHRRPRCAAGRTATSSSSAARDHQVKMRGFRIELGEIEAALARQPQVRAGRGRAARGRARATSGWSPTSCPRGDASRRPTCAPSPKQSLPDYMVPAAFVAAAGAAADAQRQGRPQGAARAGVRRQRAGASRLPARRSKRRWPTSGRGAEPATESASTTTSSISAGIRCSAVRLMGRISDALNIDLSLRQLFETPTVSGLALAAVDIPAVAATDLSR